MPRQRTLKTIEVFPSVQGEGLHQGEPTIFVRLAGCNLHCSFCDTKKAWGEGTERPIADLLSEVQRLHDDFPAAWVSITGGEPLAQDIRPLVDRLRGDGFRVQVETNGTRPPAAVADWYSVSPKPPHYDFHPGFVGRADEVKLVVCRALTFETVRSVRRAFLSGIPVILQVQSNAAWSAKKALRLLRQSSRAGLENVRILGQLHKIFGWK